MVVSNSAIKLESHKLTY